VKRLRQLILQILADREIPVEKQPIRAAHAVRVRCT
jgi:hypothetical protein